MRRSIPLRLALVLALALSVMPSGVQAAGTTTRTVHGTTTWRAQHNGTKTVLGKGLSLGFEVPVTYGEGRGCPTFGKAVTKIDGWTASTPKQSCDNGGTVLWRAFSVREQTFTRSFGYHGICSGTLRLRVRIEVTDQGTVTREHNESSSVLCLGLITTWVWPTAAS